VTSSEYGLKRARVLVVLLAISTAVGLLFATHFRVYYGIEWPVALRWGLTDWYLWGALAPVVVWLTRRVPPSRERWLRGLVLHSLAALSLALLHPTLVTSLSVATGGLGNAGFFEAIQGLFLKRYTLSLTTYVAIAATVWALDLYQRSRSRREDAARLAGTLQETSASASGERAARLLVRSHGRERFLPVDRIDRIEAEGNYVRIHAGEDSYLERRTLKAVEAQLDSSRFLRIHRSHIVNVERIDRIEPRFKGAYEVVLRDGTSLALSRTYRRRLERQVGESF